MRTLEAWKKIFGVAYRRVPLKRIFAAVALTIFAHVLVWLFAPRTIEIIAKNVPAEKIEFAEPDAMDVPEELLPEEFRKKDEPEFVPVNPNAPRAIPEPTNRHSAADQRSAQKNPDPTTRSRKPENPGELEDSRAIATNLISREFLPPELRTTQTKPPGEKAENVRENPNKEKHEHGVEAPDSGDGSVSLGETLEPPEEAREGIPDPQERPEVISPAGLNSITMKSNTATNEHGAVSLDAKYSEFGDYTQRMLEAIQAAWHIRCAGMSHTSLRGVVRVSFTLCPDGTLKNVKVLSSSAPEAATYACVDAIESRAPFEVWRPDMVALFGDEETSVISFYYR